MLGLKSLLFPFLSHEVLGCTELYPTQPRVYSQMSGITKCSFMFITNAKRTVASQIDGGGLP